MDSKSANIIRDALRELLYEPTSKHIKDVITTCRDRGDYVTEKEIDIIVNEVFWENERERNS